MFTDPYLKQYIEEGLQNNIDIRIAIQQMFAAEAYLKQGKAGYFPSLNAKGTASRIKNCQKTVNLVLFLMDPYRSI